MELLHRLIKLLMRVLGLRPASHPADPVDSTATKSCTSVPLPPVRINNRFITESEQRFYHTLVRCLPTEQTVFVQVALNRLFWMPGQAAGAKVWQNKIDRRSVDFVVCHYQTLQPLLAIELDDQSHRLEKRQQRDREVEAIFHASGLRLLRVPTTCTPEELRSLLHT